MSRGLKARHRRWRPGSPRAAGRARSWACRAYRRFRRCRSPPPSREADVPCHFLPHPSCPSPGETGRAKLCSQPRGKNVQRRTGFAQRRRNAPPHRHQGDFAGRIAGGLPRAHRRGEPRGQCRHGHVGEARAQGSEGCRNRGASRRGAAAAARPADRHQGSRGDQGPSHHLRLAALSRLRADLGQRHGRSRARGGRRRGRQDQRAGVRRRRRTAATRCGAPPAIRSIPTLNPGGSSGGSAVALATDMLPVCTGSDTGGIAAHSRRDLRRRGLPPLAGHGRGRAPRHGLDADLGAGTDGPHGGRHLPALCHADRPARFRSAQLPHRGRRLRRAVAGRSRQPAAWPGPRISAACRSRRASARPCAPR